MSCLLHVVGIIHCVWFCVVSEDIRHFNILCLKCSGRAVCVCVCVCVCALSSEVIRSLCLNKWKVVFRAAIVVLLVVSVTHPHEV